MKTLRITAGLMACLALVTVGCARVAPRAGFREVQQIVQDHGGERIAWIQGSPEDAQVSGAIHELLAKPLTPQAAVQVALLNNRDLQAAYADLGVSQAALVQAGLLSNPIFAAAVRFPHTGGQSELDFSIAQDFLNVLDRPLRVKVAAAQFETAKLETAGRVIDVAGQTLAACYRCQAASQRLELRRQILQAVTASLDAMQRIRAAGNLRKLDVDNERLLFEQARVALGEAEEAVYAAHERLNRLLGLWGADTQWTMAPRLPGVPESPPDLDRLEGRAVAASVDLAAQRARIEARHRQLGLTRLTAWFPELNLGAQSEREDGDWDSGPTFGLPIPFFDRGQARLAAAKSELLKERQLYLANAVQIRSAARSSAERLIAAQGKAQLYRGKLLPLSEQIVQESQLQYNAMQIGVFDLLQVKQRQIDLGEQYVNALEDYWLAHTGLEQILHGRLTDLGERTSAGDVATIHIMDQSGGH